MKFTQELSYYMDSRDETPVITASQRNDSAWISIRDKGTPEIVVYFSPGLAGCTQIDALMRSLEAAKQGLGVAAAEKVLAPVL